MTSDEMDRVLKLYASYRGAALTEFERAEFTIRFKNAALGDVVRAVRESADATGFMNLAGVVHRFASITEGRRPTAGTDGLPDQSSWPPPKKSAKTPLEEHEERHAAWLKKRFGG